MRCWLMKSEPDVFSIADLRRQGTTLWDGVRNHQARNHMQAMAVGDRVLFYHSNGRPSGVAGLAEVSRTGIPDHTAWDPDSDYFDPRSPPDAPRWWMVEVRFVAAFADVLPLDRLRSMPELQDMDLFRLPRLSVQAVEPRHYEQVIALGGIRTGQREGAPA